MKNGDKTTVVNNGDSSANGVSAEPEYVVPEVLPMDDEENPKHKIKGAAQIAAGTALTAAGVPMLVLPGPGAVAIAGGAALISKGQRNCSGRWYLLALVRDGRAAHLACDVGGVRVNYGGV